MASMCLVITMSNVFFVMLGWDGLGLVSFYLIVYYQNQSSIFSGLFTLLINRVGDAFFLCSISLYFIYLPDIFSFQSLIPSDILPLFFLVLTFITKRAIFPFSPWLPIAIAAPTPISALVHSSTLVTSGLFLLIKFNYLVYSSYFVTQLLLVFTIFTSFYAGINTIFEKDFKKLIALSTLRHLGFIGISFSLGLLDLAFFHLLTHALFKSLLFITIGDIIINLGHRQDRRYLSSGSFYTPASSYFIRVSLLNLLGIPSMCGYFSKDLILEASNFSNIGLFLYFIIIFNLIFTFYYTYQLFYYSFSFRKICSYSLFNSFTFAHAFLLLVLSLSTLVFGYFYMSFISIYIIFPCIPIPPKFYPFFINFIFFLYLYLFLSLFTSHNVFFNSYFSSIMFLYLFITKAIRIFYYKFSFIFVKSFEQGFIDSSINNKLASMAYSRFFRILNLLIMPPIKLLVFLLFLLPFLLFL